MTPEQVVQEQLDAYNTRDIQRFTACHDPNVELFNFPEPTPFARGREALKSIYHKIFENSPTLHSQIISRIVMGNKVIDHERITGRHGVDLLEIIAIFEVENDMIRSAHFMRKDVS